MGSIGSLKDKRIGIAGLGLMGGSLALALRGHVGRLVGIERQALTRQMALRAGVVDEAVESLTGDLLPVDLLVLATPVRAIVGTLEALPGVWPGGCGVVDLGSTKQSITAAMSSLPEGFAAIGGHPMCGKETSGLAAAAADLYRGHPFVLCRTARTTPEIEGLVRAIIDLIGAQVVYLDAAEHDAIVAAVSHLPYLVSAALMRHAAAERQWAISASGFRDTSRLAGTNPQMMIDILMTNRQAILNGLESYERDLSQLRQALASGDEAALMEWLAVAQVRHAAYRRFISSERP